jgi:hypothetical protein
VLLFFFCFTVGCRQDSEEVSSLYNQSRFDPNVIEKLPLYDSLVSAILEKSSFFQQSIDEKSSYRGYKYRPLSDDADVVKKLPQEVAAKINLYYNKLGKDFIYGFDVFKDSTIKICIRRNESNTSGVNIFEYLSYYPPGTNIQKREFPVKDTILNEHWQYWVFFDKPRLPF